MISIRGPPPPLLLPDLGQAELVVGNETIFMTKTAVLFDWDFPDVNVRFKKIKRG